MALGPQILLDKALQATAAEVERLEKLIDKALEEANCADFTEKTRGYRVNLENEKIPLEDVQRKLSDMYTKAGWTGGTSFKQSADKTTLLVDLLVSIT